MIILPVIQGSPEWYSARAGIPTASNFDKIITTKGEPSAQRQKYLYQLAGERLTGRPMETYTNGNMERGKELEAEARLAYELMTDNTVTQVGFCFENSKWWGCSPDGLVGEDGGVELKSPILSTVVGYLDKGKLPSEYYQQVEGQLLVTGREWWDFCAYFPGLPLFIVRVERDEKFINILEKELVNFCKELDELVKRIGGIK